VSQAELCSYISNLTKCSAATQTSTRFHLTPVECYSRTFSFMSPVGCKCNSRTSKIQCPLLNATHVHSEESVVPILMLGHCSHASHLHAFDVLQIRAIDPTILNAAPIELEYTQSYILLMYHINESNGERPLKPMPLIHQRIQMTR